MEKHKHSVDRMSYSAARLGVLFGEAYVTVRRDECRCGAQRLSFCADGEAGGRATGRWTRPKEAPRD
jgi:hypothetical protein